MENLSNVEKLAKYLIFVGIIAVAFAVCWYFSTVLIYVILAFVVSLISRPLARLMGKLRIKGKSAPDWLLSILSVTIVIAILLMVILLVIPVITRIINDASLFSNIDRSEGNFSDTINNWIIGIFPSLGKDFDAIGMLLNYLKGLLSDFDITGLIGSVGSIVIDIAIGLFAVVFICDRVDSGYRASAVTLFRRSYFGDVLRRLTQFSGSLAYRPHQRQLCPRHRIHRGNPQHPALCGTYPR